jgi:aspyridone synthetase trans-acting enoyl reductase
MVGVIRVREALVSVSAGNFSLTKDVPIPALARGMMLCKVFAVALNPADAKISDYSPSPGSIGGLDFAGEVIQVGPGVAAGRFIPGDRIFGLANGHNPDDKATGAFANYVLATADLACKIPDDMSFAQAATFGVAVGTAGLSLFHYLGLPLPDGTSDARPRKECYVLVSGGATSTGVVAIQFLRLSAYSPADLTMSPVSNGMVLMYVQGGLPADCHLFSCEQ